jgi:signal peptidase II
MASNPDLSGSETTGPPAMYKDLVLLQLAALIFLVDQFTKFLARELLSYGESFPRYGFFRITHTQNTGSAFGLFPDQNTALILVAFLGITILALLYRNLRPTTNLLRLSLGLQMGGAAGNLLDRLLQGHVTDFVDIGPWPVFNVADSSIVTGLVILFILHGIPWERFGRRMPGLPAQVEQYQPTWCPVCDGDMVTVMGGWRCSTCGVKERIEQVVDGYKPSADVPASGMVADPSLDGAYSGVRGFVDSHSRRIEDVPEGAAFLGTPVSHEAESVDPVLPENRGSVEDFSPDLTQEERLE